MMICRSLFLSLILFSCSESSGPITKRIAAHFEAANRHDLKALANDYTQDATGESPNWGKPMHSADSIVYQYSRIFLSTPDLHFEITKTQVGSSHAVVEYTFNGTLANLEKDVPEFMRGKKYSFPACTIFEFKDGKIVREASYFDQVAFLRQVGYFEQGN